MLFRSNISTASSQKKQIEFKYIDNNGEKEKEYKHDGFIYKLSHYALSWNDDHYYVIGYSNKHQCISNFRVDRLAKLQISEREILPPPDDFSVATYVKSVFSMFGGEEQTVEIKCANHLMKVIIDRFGKSVKTEPLGSHCFKAYIDVSVSPTFFGWVFQFDGDVSILAPDGVKDDYIKMVNRAI